MKAKTIIAIVFGGLALTFVNVMAFVFDSSWIQEAITIDSATLGAVVAYIFKDKQE